MDRHEISILLERYVSGQLDAQEMNTLRQLLQDPRNQPYLEKIIDEQLVSGRYNQDALTGLYDSIQRGVDARIAVAAPSTHRVHFLRSRWLRYAAALVVILGTIAYFRLSPKEADITAIDPSPKMDVAPGGDRATLTLSDGAVITLDSAAAGVVARQGNTSVVKLANGQLVYTPREQPEGKIMLNTMTTPNGGQYRLTLPDGTRVWLNAASSITYPTAFTGVGREVTITGEAYFDVAKNAAMPFRVATPDGASVEALGTEFNINAYPDEDMTRTTLLEGKVSITMDKQEKTLQPGQQAQINKGDISLRVGVDTDQVTAWKNGRFNFDGQNLQQVMRQLSRWYDIRVSYTGKIPELEFGGEMGRNLTLSQALEGLGGVGVKFKIEGKVLIVL